MQAHYRARRVKWAQLVADRIYMCAGRFLKHILTNYDLLRQSHLSSYLLATEKGDINQMIALSSDTRVSSKSINDFYTEILKDQSEQLSSSKILSKNVVSPTLYKFTTELTFKNGDISQVPFTLSYKQGEWKVVISPSSLEGSSYKVLKGENKVSGSNALPATSTPTFKTSVNPASLTSLCNWSFSQLYTIMYSNRSFNVNSVYSQVLVQGHQAASYGYSFTPSITYAVVHQNWYGDTVWGTTTHSGSGYYSFLINGSSASFSNAKMRFTLNNGGYADGDGNVYNN